MKQKLTDANGKTFEVTLDQLRDMTLDLTPAVNGEKAKPNFKISVKDSQGNDLDVAAIADAVKSDPGKMPAAIDVTFESTHSGQNRNYAIYHSDSMETDAQSWMSPFARPLLKNHDIESEPMGRVVNYQFKQSVLNPDRDCIEVTWRVTDQDAIPKFLDGRYGTMSIGASGNHISCGICGKDILKDGKVTFCGHWKGETYNQKCYWNVKNMEYREGSVVNSPADDWAQATAVKVVNQKDSQQSDSGKGGNTMDQMDDKSKEPDILSQIDNLTNNQTDNGDNKDTQKKADGTQSDNDGNANSDTGDTGAAATGDGSGDTGAAGTEDTQEDGDKGGEEGNQEDAELQAITAERDNLKAENETLRNDNQDLTNKLNAANDKIKELEKQLGDEKNSEDALKEEVRVADEEAKANRKQSIQLALLNKDLLAHRVVDHKIFLGEAKQEDRETLVTELKTKPAKELSDSIATLSAKKVTRQLASVNSPALPNQNDAHAVNDDDEQSENNNKSKEPTMADFAETVVDALMSNKN
jgi:hypothetical protein